MKCKEYRARKFPGIRFNNAFEVGEKVAIDIFGPIENQYIIVAVDYFSRKGYAMAISSRETHKVIAFLNRVNKDIKIKTLICDNAKEFTSKKLDAWCKENSTKLHKTTPYHHQANGKAERFIRTIREGLQMCEIKGPIKVKLSYVLDKYNSLKHTGIGISPNEALNPEEWPDM